MKRIIEFYDNLSTRNKIIILCICMLVMVFFIFRMKNSEENTGLYSNNLNYKNISIESLLEDFSEDYNDRDNYLIIKKIVDELNSKYNPNKNIYSEYYDAVDTNYKRFISKKNFKNKINDVFYKVKENNNEYSIKLYSEDGISNVYIVEIVCNETIGYIGIQLDWTNKQYYIFYLQ